MQDEAKWLEMWKRGYQQIKAALPDSVIERPSTAGGVGGWFTAFLDYVKTNNVVPDYIGWHEAGGTQPVSAGPAGGREWPRSAPNPGACCRASAGGKE